MSKTLEEQLEDEKFRLRCLDKQLSRQSCYCDDIRNEIKECEITLQYLQFCIENNTKESV